MEAKIISQGKDDAPQLTDIATPIVDWSQIQSITFCVIEAGMASGEPAVAIVSESTAGSVFLMTSLDKFLTGASTMASIAEDRWGWTRPEGHFTIMPPNGDVRKKMLEEIKKALEEWDDES